MKKYGILTWHYYYNFGSALQAYALQTAVENLGHQSVIINYRNTKFSNNPRKEKICELVGRAFQYIPFKAARSISYPYHVFRKRYMHQTQHITDPKDLLKLLDGIDGVICGSDQIWAPNVLNTVYMLDWAPSSSVKKISYAASIGLNEIPEALKPTYMELLCDFDALSVREERGRQLLEDVCRLETTVVLDPTFLLEANSYREIQRKVYGLPKRFVFCYFLKKDHNYRTRVEQYAATHNLQIVGVSANQSDDEWMQMLKHIGPAEFLWLIDNSSAVFTDSYHGTAFSLLLHKIFFTFERFSEEDPICQNSRIYQLDQWFGIGDRILNAVGAPENCKEINYDVFEKKLYKAREISNHFLSEALNNNA